MAKRRSNADIDATQRLHDATNDLAWAIERRVNGEHDDGPAINAVNIGGVKAEHQHRLADTMVVSFSSKDPAVIERVARAIREAMEKEGAAPGIL